MSPNIQAMLNTHIHSNALASKEKSKGNGLHIKSEWLLSYLSNRSLQRPCPSTYPAQRDAVSFPHSGIPVGTKSEIQPPIFNEELHNERYS